MKTPTIEHPHPAGMGGVQRIYRYENGYGASVIQFAYSYGGDEGKWELAVIKYQNKYSEEFRIAYDTPITGDVLGYLSEDEVDDILTQIEALPEEQP